PGTVATVGIPCAAGEAGAQVRVNGKLIWRDGAPAKQLTGVQFRERTPEYLLFQTSPGRWKFSAAR
ncbi:MAG TPA: hypothetical protein VNT26_15735, partial [Candidatus Sulfotelmatobacter sp.]|nr:hypothetical protein [Candidatus Sulfotelmatobacter sp.]